MAKIQANSTLHEWMDLKGLTTYAAISERTLRDWIHRPHDALPASQVGGKLLVKRSTFDRWLEAHPATPMGAIDVDKVAGEVLADLVGK